MFDYNNFSYKIGKVDYVIDTIFTKNERKTFNFIKTYNISYTEKLNIYNLKTNKKKKLKFILLWKKYKELV